MQHVIKLGLFVSCEVYCPPGTENKPGSNVCTECPQGFYKNNEAAALCHPCPTGFVTRINGSTSRYDCQLSEHFAFSYRFPSKTVTCD